MKAWYNTIDGTVYEEPTDYKAIPLDVQELLDRREDYNRVPNDVVLLSAGVNTQGDRFEVTVLGWKSSREKYLIAHYVIMGDPATVSTQKKLDELLFTKFFATECGGEMKIFCSAIDTQGNKTDYIYRYVQQRRNKKIYAIKGGRNIDDPLVNTFTDTTTKGKGNLKLWVLGVNSGKDDIMEDLREEFGTRYIHFPRNMKHFYGTKSDKYSTSDNDYFTQLLVEKLDINGRWQNEFRRRNEALDCMNYANASVKIVKGLDINKIVSAGIKAYYRKPEE